MLALLIALRLLLPQVPAPAQVLSVREDPVLQGNLIVGVTLETQGSPIDVTWYPSNGARPVTYRSPDPSGFGVCAFLREVGAARVRGPHDVIVRRGDLATRIRLDYDGRTCLRPYPTVAVGPPKRRSEPLPTPPSVGPVPVAVIGPIVEEWRAAEAVVEKVSLRFEGRFLVFEVEFDRNLKLEPAARVTVRSLVRVDHDRELIERPAGFLVRKTSGRSVSWKVDRALIPFHPAYSTPERIRLSFTLDEKDFDGYTVVLGS